MNCLDQMTINVVNYLEKKPGICQVKNEVQAPAERHTVIMWEQKHSLLLPADLKNFYLSSNGFHLTWSVKMENTSIPVGTMHINSVGQLSRLENGMGDGTHSHPSLWDLDMEDERDEGLQITFKDLLNSLRLNVPERKVPRFVDSRMFELDPCDGFGKVCLVYSGAPKDYSSSESDSEEKEEADSGFTSPCEYTTKIWFLDRSLRWHYICDTFLAYYRLVLMHLGLPHWHFAFTDIGLPPCSKQWYNMYAPIRLEVDMEGGLDVTAQSEMDLKAAASPLDLKKVFKEKSDRSKATVAQPNTASLSTKSIGPKKLKAPISSARSATSVSKEAGQSSSQVAIKSSR